MARIAGGAAVAGLLACIALVAGEEPSASLVAPGGVATFLGNLTGLAGTYLAMLMVLLASRIPALERVAGLDGLLRWHRRVAPWPLGLITLHALLLTVGFAQTSHSGIAHEIGTLVTSYPDMLAAFVGFGLMLAIGVVSIRALRRRLRRETWWAVHLYMYLAIAMSFPHIVVLG
ncbi:MAG TPA: ferric reductase-like transmembrane domain-containing protein, partial [Acidimicrobiales bacterium]|nr:ferric reductase-like transmembrane domain-containing protein [Acidimicrobiales bacterium]